MTAISRRLCCLVLLLTAQTVGAQDAQVRIEFDPPDEIRVGERVSFYVVLLTPDRFSGVPQFDLPNVEGAILLKNSGSAFSSSERIDGETWTTQRHRYSVFAQRGGVIAIPEINARFETRSGTDDPTPHALPTEAFEFSAQLPAGAERLSALVATGSLDVKESWDPEPGETIVGGAFTRTVTRTAPNVMAMAFPPLPQPELDGLAVYPGDPEVGDQESRGQLTGRRVDRITYVIEEPGTYVFPSVVIPWFDLGSKELKTEELPSVTIVATAKPQAVVAESTTETAGDDKSANLAGLLAIVLVLAVCAGVVWWYRDQLRTSWNQWRRTRSKSEAACFRRFAEACRSGNALATLNTLMSWLDRTRTGQGPATIAEFLHGIDDADLATRLARLQRAAVEHNPGWSDDRLPEAITFTRRRQRAAGASPGQQTIPELNPGGHYGP